MLLYRDSVTELAGETPAATSTIGPASMGRVIGRKLNISIVTETYPPEVNGVANTIKYCLDGLISKGHQVTLIRPSQGTKDKPAQTDRLTEKLVTGVSIPFYKSLRFGLPAFRAIWQTWKVSIPDVIYIATEGPLGFAALKVARRLSIPVVSGFHTNFDYYSRCYHLSLLEKPVMAYLRYFHLQSARTLVPTSDMKNQLSAKGINNGEVFARGVDVELFRPGMRSATLRNQWGVGYNTLTVIYVGRIAAEKNLYLAVQAFEKIRKVQPDSRFILVGAGPLKEVIQSNYPEFIFCGEQTGQALARHYASADLFIFPSLSETYGNVVLEAMASGLPVVGFDYAAVAEHVRNGFNGFKARFTHNNDFLLAAERAAQCEGLKALGKQARRSVEALSWSRLNDQFEFILTRECKDDQHLAKVK